MLVGVHEKELLGLVEKGRKGRKEKEDHFKVPKGPAG
jgi:hypothetical protein